jgi:competence protein ComEA
MRPGVYAAAMWLSMLVAAPVVAQSTPPTTSSPPGATRPGATPPGVTPPGATTAPKTAVPGQPPAAAGPQAPGGLVDINSAPVDELDKLPGVGPARANAIISHRPYNGKDDLTHRKIIPQNVYDQIKDKIIARQGTAK